MILIALRNCLYLSLPRINIDINVCFGWFTYIYDIGGYVPYEFEIERFEIYKGKVKHRHYNGRNFYFHLNFLPNKLKEEFKVQNDVSIDRHFNFNMF